MLLVFPRELKCKISKHPWLWYKLQDSAGLWGWLVLVGLNKYMVPSICVIGALCMGADLQVESFKWIAYITTQRHGCDFCNRHAHASSLQLFGHWNPCDYVVQMLIVLCCTPGSRVIHAFRNANVKPSRTSLEMQARCNEIRCDHYMLCIRQQADASYASCQNVHQTKCDGAWTTSFVVLKLFVFFQKFMSRAFTLRECFWVASYGIYIFIYTNFDFFMYTYIC